MNSLSMLQNGQLTSWLIPLFSKLSFVRNPLFSIFHPCRSLGIFSFHHFFQIVSWVHRVEEGLVDKNFTTDLTEKFPHIDLHQFSLSFICFYRWGQLENRRCIIRVENFLNFISIPFVCISSNKRSYLKWCQRLVYWV